MSSGSNLTDRTIRFGSYLISSTCKSRSVTLFSSKNRAMSSSELNAGTSRLLIPFTPALLVELVFRIIHVACRCRHKAVLKGFLGENDSRDSLIAARVGSPEHRADRLRARSEGNMEAAESGAYDTPFTSFGLFYDPKHLQVLLHLRSADARVNPAKWALFGGTSEEGETPVECFCREIREELGLQLDVNDVRQIRRYSNPRTGMFRHVFVVERFVLPESIVLREGSGFGWIPASKAQRYDLTDASRSDLAFFLSSINPGT